MLTNHSGVIGAIPGIIMTIWTRHPNSVPIAAAYASYFITYAVQASGLILLAWFTDMYAYLLAFFTLDAHLTCFLQVPTRPRGASLDRRYRGRCHLRCRCWQYGQDLARNPSTAL
jgi:hypothetical protein